MALHIIKGNGVPSIAPPEIGMHYVDLTGESVYMSVGTDSAADWVLAGGSSTSFTTFKSLLDTPNDYAGHAGKFAKVNTGENALEFGFTNIGNLDDVDDTGKQDIQVLEYDLTTQTYKPSYRMEWKGAWSAGSYKTNQVVTDGSWTMISNKPTSDRAGPQTINDPAYALPETPTWTQQQETLNATSGMIFNLTEPRLVDGIRMWRPTNTANAEYSLVLKDITDPANPILLGTEPVPTGPVGWVDVNVSSRIFLAGTVLEVYLYTKTFVSQSTWTHTWTLTGTNGETPTSGNYTRDATYTNLYIHKDADGPTDVSADMNLLKAGDEILFFEFLNSARFDTYELTSTPTLNGSVYECPVTRTANGQAIRTGVISQGDATINASLLPSDYVFISNWWASNPPDGVNANGYIKAEPSDTTVLDSNGYGLDLRSAIVQKSDDWDIVAYNSTGGTGGGGGGASLFTELTDTPNTYVGEALKNVRVKADETGLEFVAGGGGVSNFYELNDTPANYGGKGKSLVSVNEAEDGLNFDPIKEIQFNTVASAPAHSEGKMFYDPVKKCWTFYNDRTDVSLQVGRETWRRAYNDTGVLIPNGAIVCTDGWDSGSGLPTACLASNFTEDLAIRAIGMATEDIPNGESGEVTVYGEVGGLDTSSFTSGDVLWLGVNGAIISEPPIPPYYPVRIGTVGNVNAITGTALVDIAPYNNNDTGVNSTGMLNGTCTQLQGVTFPVEGGIVYADVVNEQTPSINLPFMIGGKIYGLNTLSGAGVGGAARVALTEGWVGNGIEGDPEEFSNAQINFIYVELVATVPTLKASTTFPTGVDKAWIGIVSIYDAATTAADGPFSWQRYNNSVDNGDGNGAMNYVTERIRLSGALYQSGVEPTLYFDTGTSPDSFHIKTAFGIVSQLHSQVFDALNQTLGQEQYWIVNDPDVGLKKITNLNEITKYADGTLIADNERLGLNLLGVQSSSGGTDKLLISLPSGGYTTDDAAINDVSNFANPNVPSGVNLTSTSFRICRAVVRYDSQAGGQWTNVLEGTNVQDERGSLLGKYGGGGGGGSSFVSSFSDNDFSWYSAGTPAILATVDLSNLTASREITFPDKSGTMAMTSDIVPAPVDSVFGRTGVVTAQTDDYNADQVNDATTTNKFATQAQLDQIATNTSDIAGKEPTLPLSTRGDILVRNASNVTARLPIGANTQVLTSDGTDVSWQDPTGGGGATKFDALTDTPSDKTGSAGLVPVVNDSETDLVYEARRKVLTSDLVIDVDFAGGGDFTNMQEAWNFAATFSSGGFGITINILNVASLTDTADLQILQNGGDYGHITLKFEAGAQVVPVGLTEALGACFTFRNGIAPLIDGSLNQDVDLSNKFKGFLYLEGSIFVGNSLNGGPLLTIRNATVVSTANTNAAIRCESFSSMSVVAFKILGTNNIAVRVVGGSSASINHCTMLGTKYGLFVSTGDVTGTGFQDFSDGGTFQPTGAVDVYVASASKVFLTDNTTYTTTRPKTNIDTNQLTTDGWFLDPSEPLYLLNQSMDGDFTTGSWSVSKVGINVTFQWSAAQHPSATSAVTSTPIPAEFRPSTDKFISQATNTTMINGKIGSNGLFTSEYRNWSGSLIADTACVGGSISWVLDT